MGTTLRCRRRSLHDHSSAHSATRSNGVEKSRGYPHLFERNIATHPLESNQSKPMRWRSFFMRRHVFALTFILALGPLVATPVAFSQVDDAPSEDAPDERSVSGGGGFFAIGANAPNLGALDDALDAAGYPTFDSEMLAIGGGGYGLVGRVMVGGEGFGLIAPTRGFEGRELSVGGGYGLFTLGYLLTPERRFDAFPVLGIGGGGLSFDIGSEAVDTFDDVLENPSRGASMEQFNLLVQIGAGAEYPLQSDGGLRIGLRAGYLLTAFSSDWTINDQSIGGGPDATLGGPFVRLTIGGGRYTARCSRSPLLIALRQSTRAKPVSTSS